MKYVIIANLQVMPAFISAGWDKKGKREYDTFGITTQIGPECMYEKDDAEKFAKSLRGNDEKETIPVVVVHEKDAQDTIDLMEMEIKLGA